MAALLASVLLASVLLASVSLAPVLPASSAHGKSLRAKLLCNGTQKMNKN